VYEQQLTIGSSRDYRALLDEWIVPPVPFLLFAIRDSDHRRVEPAASTATATRSAVRTGLIDDRRRFEEYCA